MDPDPAHPAPSVQGNDSDPVSVSNLRRQAIDDIARLAEARDHENLKAALELQAERLAEVIEAALLQFYKNTDNRKQSMECLINNATNWFFGQFSATDLLVNRWEHLPLHIIAIVLFALDIALDTRPVLERVLAVSATAACDGGAIDSLNKSLLIPLMIDPLLRSQTMYGFMYEASSVEESAQSPHDLPSCVQSLLNKYQNYPAIALAGYLASPILLPRLDYEPYCTYERNDTIERLARQCLAKYNGGGIADHISGELQMALKKVLDIAQGPSGINHPAAAEATQERARELVGIVDKADPLILRKPA